MYVDGLQYWHTLRTEIQLYMQSTTYKVSHIDIDTSCKKVVGLSTQTIITCFKQLHLLEHMQQSGRKGGEGERGCGVYNRVQRTW